MRVPTPHGALYRWHAEALAGRNPVITDDPHCGWYKRKLVKGGVMVPARIWLFQPVDAVTGELTDDEAMQCEVNGGFADPVDAWPWLCANPISEAEFHYLMARVAYAARHEPDDAFGDQRHPINLNKIPIGF